MKLDYKTPKTYEYMMPIFEKNNRITNRVRTGLENVLFAYVDISKRQAKISDNNSKNYKINEAYVVGSGARLNRVDSDMDLMLITPNLDDESAKQLRFILSLIYLTDRPKQEGIDVYVRSKDKYPDRPSIKITDQVKDLLDTYNKKL